MKAPLLVIDSSFVWDIYGIPMRKPDLEKTVSVQQEAKDRLKAAIERECRCFLPYLVIFETANSIAKVRDRDVRRRLAQTLARDVGQSIAESAPWIITPDEKGLQEVLSGEELLRRCDEFSAEFADHRIGLVDVFILQEARRLKRQDDNRKVHIWTNDRGLKRFEPDPESDNWLQA